MTFGEQNSESDAHSQLDYAIEKGINFIDTAEMYPIAACEATLGETERYIGTWLKKSGKRDDLVIATKIAGPNRKMEYIRNPLDFSKKSIHEAVDLSLKNLQTEYIDLYQMHRVDLEVPLEETLSALTSLVSQGKIRYLGATTSPSSNASSLQARPSGYRGSRPRAWPPRPPRLRRRPPRPRSGPRIWPPRPPPESAARSCRASG